MKYLGYHPGQEIKSNGHKTLYCYTYTQEREVIGYYV